MPGQKKRTNVRKALLLRAQREIAPDATALDYVAVWLTSGRSFDTLAASLADEMGESCSRTFLSFTVHRLSDDSSARIRAARGQHQIASYHALLRERHGEALYSEASPKNTVDRDTNDIGKLPAALPSACRGHLKADDIRALGLHAGWRVHGLTLKL